MTQCFLSASVCLRGPIRNVLANAPLLGETKSIDCAQLHLVSVSAVGFHLYSAHQCTSSCSLPVSVCGVQSGLCSPTHHVCRRLLGGFQDSASESTSSPSDLLNHKVLIKTVQVHQACNKEPDRFCVGFKDSKG